MNKSLPPEIQRRLHALYRYVKAMETGDLEDLADLLHMAEQDAILDRVFQEVDLYYQAQDQMQFQPRELAAVEQQIEQLSMQEIERVETPPGSQRTQAPPIFASTQERKQTTMHYRPTPITTERETRGIPQIQASQQKPEKKRSTRFLQTLAAVLLVVALSGGFLALYTHLTKRQQGLGVTAQPTAQIQPPGMIIGVTNSMTVDYPPNSPTATFTANANYPSTTATFTAYALRSAHTTPIWATSLMQLSGTSGPPSVPLFVQQGVAYIEITNHVFALRTNTGKLLWQKTLPFDPANQTTLQIDGNILIAGGEDTNFVASLYRLNEQDGSLLWHYQTDNNIAFAVSNGVVYAGKDEVNSLFTPNPGTLRFLVALNGENGSVLWSHNNIDPLGITVKNGTIYVQSIAADNVGSDKRSFLSAWTSSGHMLWSVTAPVQAPIVNDSGLFVIENGNDLCAYQATNGHKTWCSHNPTTTVTVNNMKTTVGASYSDYEAQNSVLYDAYTLQTSGTSTHQSTAAFLEARNIQSGAIIWSQKVGTEEIDITRKGSAISNAIKGVGLNFGDYSPILLSQNTLSITTGTSVFTFSLANGQQLWQTNLKTSGDFTNFVGSVYVAP